MPELDTPTPSVVEEVTPASEGTSLEAVGSGEAVGETVEHVEGQAAEGVQPSVEPPAEDFEEKPPVGAGEKHLRDYGERWETKARGYETALMPLGGLEGVQELSEPLMVLSNPSADVVDKFAAITRIDPTFSQAEFVGTALDAMSDEDAAPLLKERADDAVKVLFGDILPDITYEQARGFLDYYKPDVEQLPDSVKAELEAARTEREQFKTEREQAQAEQNRNRQEAEARQLEAAQLELGKSLWEVPTEHVINKLKFGELPKDAPEGVKQDFERGMGYVRQMSQVLTLSDPQAVNLMRLMDSQLRAALKAPPEQREALRARAQRTASAVAQIQKTNAAQVGEWVKGLLDDRLALRSSEGFRATSGRAEVTGGFSVSGNGKRSPMPAYGTPEWEKWSTDGFRPEPTPSYS